MAKKKKRAKAKKYDEVESVKPPKPLKNVEPAKSTKSFRLPDLPPELWSKIGKMAVLDAPCCWTETIGCVAQPPRRARTKAIRSSNIPVPAARQRPPITRVCKVLREELLAFHYSNHMRLFIYDTGTQFGTIGKWLRAIGAENRRALGEVTICIWWGMPLHPLVHDGGGTAFEKWMKKHWRIDLRAKSCQILKSIIGDIVKFGLL